MAKPKVTWDRGVEPPKRLKKVRKTHRPLMPGVGLGKLQVDEDVTLARVEMNNRPIWEPNAQHVAPPPKNVELDNKFDAKSVVKTMPKFVRVTDVKQPLSPGMYRTRTDFQEYKTDHPFPMMAYGYHRFERGNLEIPEGSVIMFIKNLLIEEIHIADKSSRFGEHSNIEKMKSVRTLFLYNGKPVIIGDTTYLDKL